MNRSCPTREQSLTWFVSIMKARRLFFEDSQDRWTLLAGLLDATGALCLAVAKPGDIAGAAADVANVASQIASRDWVGPERS